VLAQLDKIQGVERTYANHTGNMVRVAVALATNPETVAEQVVKILTQEKRNPVRLRNAEFKQALDQEQWRSAERVSELSLIEYRTLAVRLVRQFAQSEKLDKVTSEKLVKITEEEWDRLAKGAAGKDQRSVDWRARCAERAASVVERAKSLLTAEQVERLKDWVKCCLEGKQPGTGK
jgi:hypothetical protein